MADPSPSSVLRHAPRHVIDWRYLVEALEMACEIRGCSLRTAAEQMGISASGLSRLRQGDHLAGDSLAALIAWLFPATYPKWIVEASDG